MLGDLNPSRKIAPEVLGELSPLDSNPAPTSPDGLSIEEVYRTYAKPLRNFCRKRLGNSADADDVVQEVMIKAYYYGFPKLRPGLFWPWLSTVASHLCVDIARREALMPLLGPAEVAKMELEPGPDFEEEVDRRERALIVARAIKRLPKRDRQYVELQKDGWSYREIASFLGVSVASVKSALYRSRRILTEEITRKSHQSGQWPLPALVPWAFLRPRRLFGRLRARLERVQEKAVWATQAGSAGVFTNLATGVAITLTLTGTLAVGSIYLLQRSDPASSVLSSQTPDRDLSGTNEGGNLNGSNPAVSKETPSTTRTVSSEISSKAVAPNAPEASTSTVVRVSRGEKVSISAKVEGRFGDTPLIEDEEDDYYSFDCDDDQLNRATCAAIDAIPST